MANILAFKMGGVCVMKLLKSGWPVKVFLLSVASLVLVACATTAKFEKRMDAKKGLTKEQLINELNYDLTYKNGQNIGRLIEEILLHPKTAITDEKKQFIFDAFMYIGDDILRNVKLKYDGNNVKENLLALFNDFINILSLNDKDKKYEIILNSFDDKSDSLNIYAEYIDSLCNISPRHITGLISVFDINITMKNNLKNKLKDRIEEFYLSWKILDVPYLSGCFMFLRVESLKKIGFFDDGIFMYGEETDLCRRLIDGGYRTVFNPNATIYHHFEKGSHKSFHLTKIGIQSAIYYFNKWGWFFDEKRKKINKQILDKL